MTINFDRFNAGFKDTAEQDQHAINELLKLNKNGGRIRFGKAVRVNNIFRKAILAIIDLIFKNPNLKEYENINHTLERKVLELKGENVDWTNKETLMKMKTLLRVQARIHNSGWEQKNLKEHGNYENFKNQITEIQDVARKSLASIKQELKDKSAKTETEKELYQLMRWSTATEFQCQFAEYMGNDSVPMNGKEVPLGTILLTDPAADAIGHKIRGHKLRSTELRKLFLDATFIKMTTGRGFTHSALSLGQGEYFHMDKREGQKPGGVIESEKDWGEDKFLHRYVMIEPNRAEIEKELKGKSLEQFLSEVNETARKEGTKKKARFKDVFKIAFPCFGGMRSEEYTKSEEWNREWDKDQGLSCSATLSCLFAKHGVDIGKDFRKKANYVTPNDLYNSRFFRKI